MIDFRDRFNGLIDEFLSGDISLQAFQQRYEKAFIEEMPDSALDDTELEIYGAIHEKSEWTTVEPTAEDKRYGWLNPVEFKTWLTDYRTRNLG